MAFLVFFKLYLARIDNNCKKNNLKFMPLRYTIIIGRNWIYEAYFC